jgi:hypothetical protein
MERFVKKSIIAEELTLRYHDSLNPKLWNGDSLKSEIRSKLLVIAHTWAAFANIKSEAIVDIILVGGNANYNYTDFSDIDLHIVIDTDKMPDCKLLDDYLKDKKQLWGLVHDISIYGHDVELYAQDKSVAYTMGQGVYSIKNDQWLVHPEKTFPDLEDPAISSKVDQYKQKINTLIDSNADDAAFESLKKKFREMRTAGLKQAGEFSTENLVFKELRNQGYLDKMVNYINSRKDKELSL